MLGAHRFGLILHHPCNSLTFFFCIRVTIFGDNLNVVNVSGIVVVFLGVFFYKVTLHLGKMEKENLSNDENNTLNNTLFSRISSLDGYENEPSMPRRHKNSDPDIALTFKIDDEDIDEDVLLENGSSLRGRSNGPFEVDEREEENGIT